MGQRCRLVVIDLGIVNDAFVEGPEQFNIALLSPSSSSGAATTVSIANNNVTTEINDTLGAGQDPDFARWALTGDTTVDENGTAEYTLALSGQFGAGEDALINLSLANLDTTSADYQNFAAAVNTAVAAYAGDGTVTFDGTTVTFTATDDGDSLTDLTFELAAVDDVLVEGDEDFRVSISNARSTTGGEIITGTTAVTTTIIDNDIAEWTITGDTSVAEGFDAKYVVNLAGTLQAGETASIELSIGDINTTSADYANFVTAVNDAITNYTGPGALAFDGMTLTVTSDGNPMGDLCIELTAVDDVFVEGSENFTVSIANPASTTGSDIATGGTTTVTTTITDNDVATWSITGDAVVGEGDDAKYTVSLAGTLQAGETATIELHIGNVTAIAPDFANFVSPQLIQRSQITPAQDH